MEKFIKMPCHQPPKLHENGAIISFENCYKLAKIYKEIIGEHGIHHFSINVVDQLGRMSILSYRPQIAYNIFKDGSYLYNGSISPTYYNSRDFYSWDETYDPSYYHILKNNMERKNGIEKGIVFVKKEHGLTLLYSFATRKNGDEFAICAQEQTQLFYAMGDHCFEQINSIIQDRVIGQNVEQNEKCKIIKFPNRRKI